MYVSIDRRKAGELGVSAGQVGQQLRNSIFGAKAGIYKEDGEDYDIYVRFNEEDKYNKSAIFQSKKLLLEIQPQGKIKEIPVSAVTNQKNNSGFSAIKHKGCQKGS